MTEIYSGCDKSGYYTLIDGDKFRPIGFEDGYIVILTPTLEYRKAINREMVRGQVGEELPTPENWRHVDRARTAITGFIDLRNLGEGK